MSDEYFSQQVQAHLERSHGINTLLIQEMGQSTEEKKRFQMQLMSALKAGCGTISQPNNDEVIFDRAIYPMILVAGSNTESQ